ncbi:MAG: STAS domain-containing protein [Negativicutes bacterium]|nr:STAS domain-containing protein [Negativicutes bacterium]
MNNAARQKDTEKLAEKVTAISSMTGEYIVLVLGGKMVYENSEEFSRALEAKLRGKACYIVDVDQLERLDSTGFGVLITFARKVAAMEGQIGFVASNEFHRDLFIIAKFDHVFPIADSREQVWQMIKDGFQPQFALTQY